MIDGGQLSAAIHQAVTFKLLSVLGGWLVEELVLLAALEDEDVVEAVVESVAVL
jgi:hypothetical protein